MPLSPIASWTLVAIVVGLPTLALWAVLRVASVVSRAEERALHTHTCSRCGRVQRWTEPFDQFSPCRACMVWQPEIVERSPAELAARRPYDDQVKGHCVRGAPTLELDLEDFADGEAMRRFLSGAEPLTARDGARNI